MFRYIACLFLFALLTSCTAAAPVTPTGTQPPSPASPAPSLTVQPSPTVLPPTAVPQPSATLQPSATVDPATYDNEYAFAQNRRLGRGINLGNALEAPNEGEWGLTLEAEHFKIIKEGGFNSVRVPIRWNAHAMTEAPYTIDEDFFQRVDWVLEQAAANDLAVILNIHHYEEIMAAPAEQKERFLAIWAQIAGRYQDAPDSVYFELLNEPNGRISSTQVWNDIAAEGIALIRVTNPERTLIVGPGNWNNVTHLRNLKLPEADRNIIVTFHFYSPFQFTHQGAEWVQNSEPWLGTKWEGSEAEQVTLLSEMDVAVRWSEKNGRPIFMGEFGAYSKADDESRNRWTAFMVRSAEERGFSWAYWEFASGFGAYNRDKGAWNEPIYTALMQ